MLLFLFFSVFPHDFPVTLKVKRKIPQIEEESCHVGHLTVTDHSVKLTQFSAERNILIFPVMVHAE